MARTAGSTGCGICWQEAWFQAARAAHAGLDGPDGRVREVAGPQPPRHDRHRGLLLRERCAPAHQPWPGYAALLSGFHTVVLNREQPLDAGVMRNSLLAVHFGNMHWLAVRRALGSSPVWRASSWLISTRALYCPPCTSGWHKLYTPSCIIVFPGTGKTILGFSFWVLPACGNARAGQAGGSPWAAAEGQDFLADHASRNIDFATFHAWVDNWKARGPAPRIRLRQGTYPGLPRARANNRVPTLPYPRSACEACLRPGP